MKNKKGIMVEFLVRVIIAILFFWGAFAIGNSLFRVTSQAEQSFNQLTELIEIVNTDGGTESMNLVMDQKTAIFGFSKNADEIMRFKGDETPLDNCESDKNCHSFVERPQSCEQGKACICYCKKYEAKKVFTDRIGGYEGICKKPGCFSFDGIDFLNQISEIKLAFYSKDTLLPQISNPQIIYNGFIFERAKTDSGSWVDGPHGLLKQINMPTRSRGIYVQKYKGIVSVCADHPCISEEMKNERTPITIEEFDEANFMFVEGWMIGVDYFPEDDYLETFYYIEDIKKDFLGNYYYQYKRGNRPKTAPEQAGFLDELQEKTKQDFESRFINYAKQGKLVEIDYDNPNGNIKNFKSETKMDKQGKVINVGGIGGSYLPKRI